MPFRKGDPSTMKGRPDLTDADYLAKLSEYLNVYTSLRDKTPKELTDLALNHMSRYVSDMHYEQVIEELCTRVYPNWSDETDDSTSITQPADVGKRRSGPTKNGENGCTGCYHNLGQVIRLPACPMHDSAAQPAAGNKEKDHG